MIIKEETLHLKTAEWLHGLLKKQTTTTKNQQHDSYQKLTSLIKTHADQK
jgi:hypothetical protein